MINRMNRGCVLCAMLLAAGALAAGCQFFAPEHQERSVDKYAVLQAGRGAAADATLYPQHFDGAQLNSLGRQKLRLMTAAAPSQPMVIYIVAPEGGNSSARADAVKSYLQVAGVSNVQVKSGPNPDNATSAAEQLARLYKVESGAPQGGTSSATYGPSDQMKPSGMGTGTGGH